TVTELEARTRADRRKIDALEHQLSTLKLRVVEAESSAVPPLPVEVRAPEPAPEAEEYGRVVGVDEDGVEIVYVGDAAREGSVTPRLPAYASARPAPATG